MTLHHRLFSSCGQFVVLGLLLLYAIGSARADVTYFTDESAFAAAVANLTLESFETSAGPSATVNFGDLTVAETSAFPSIWSTSAPTKVTNGQFALEMFTDGPSTVTFTFAEPMSGFGIHIISFGTTGPGTLTVTDNSAATTPQILAASNPLLPPLNDIFFGVFNTDAPFTQITFSMTTTGDAVSFDGLQSCSEAAAIPEPANSALVAITLLLGGALRRPSRKHR
jgi:hypothetical protein